MVKGTILPCYTKSQDQLADIFTKSASLKVSFIPSGFLTKVLTRQGHTGSKLSYSTRLSLRGSVNKTKALPGRVPSIKAKPKSKLKFG
ncbi:unnamed protein product [Cochlearia groenlandica]